MKVWVWVWDEKTESRDSAKGETLSSGHDLSVRETREKLAKVFAQRYAEAFAFRSVEEDRLVNNEEFPYMVQFEGMEPIRVYVAVEYHPRFVVRGVQ